MHLAMCLLHRFWPFRVHIYPVDLDRIYISADKHDFWLVKLSWNSTFCHPSWFYLLINLWKAQDLTLNYDIYIPITKLIFYNTILKKNIFGTHWSIIKLGMALGPCMLNFFLNKIYLELIESTHNPIQSTCF
jgi:hypothetical protein